MSKKKKRKGKDSKKLNPQQLEEKLRSLFKDNPKNRYNAAQLVQKLEVENNEDSVQFVLDHLVDRKFLVKIGPNKFKINKESGPEKSSSRGGDSIATGRVDMTRSGAAYIVSEDSGLNQDIYVPQGRLANALNGDTVKVRWFTSRRGKPEGTILEVIQRNREAFIGTLVLSKQFCFVSPDDESMPVDIIVSRKKTMDAQNGDKVVVEIVQWHEKNGQGNPLGDITTVLGQAGTSDIEMKSILIKHGFNLTFPAEVMVENEEVPTVILPSEINQRRDMREILTLTIDPVDAKDFDDAISMELLANGNYEIGIHIADVTHYIKEGSALDKEAAKRTTSVYLVDRVLPMLPEKLSNGVCSLRPHEDKLTFSAIFEFTPEGNIVNEWFGKTVIHSNRRFAYEEVQEILDSGEGDYADELRLLNKFAHKLRKDRFKKGSISFESPEVKFILDEHGKPLSAYVKERKDAHMLVEDFMLLANRKVAALIMESFRQGGPRIPFLYRVHDLPDMEKVENFANFATRIGFPLKVKSADTVASAFNNLLKQAEGTQELAVLQQLAIRTMAKAAYSIDNIGHYGLAFEDYTHFTSPIRRYADVLVHRLLFEYLEKKPMKMNPAKLEETCKFISRKERQAMEAERESIKYKQAEFLLDHLGEAYEGIITGMTDFGIYVLISSNYCEGMVKYDKMYSNFVLSDDGYYIKSPEKTYKMGDTVWVRVLRVDVQKRQIDLELLEENQAKKEFVEQEMKAEQVVDYIPEVIPPIKELAESNGNEIEVLYDQVASSYELSDAKQVAKQLEKEWYYALSETPIIKNSLVLLGFNWKADGEEAYLAQTHLPNSLFDTEKWSKFLPLHKTYLSEYPLSTIIDTVFCPFRTQEEGQVSTNDLEKCEALFQQWMKILEPKQVISFSGRLRDYFEHRNLLSGMQELNLESGKRRIKVIKGFYKIGRKKIAIAFLPAPNTSILAPIRKEAWEWALEMAKPKK